jgi:hypothetical protein
MGSWSVPFIDFSLALWHHVAAVRFKEEFMARQLKRRFAVFLMVFAVTTFIAAVIGLVHKQEPFYSWFYCFAWWSYILSMQALLHYCGARSLLFHEPREFFLLPPLSLTIWLVFEVFNFRLQNWHYLNVPSSLPIRWFGYALAFSTVLPGIITTLHFLDHIGVPRHNTAITLIRSSFLCRAFPVLGWACLMLPLAWPQYFFPLIWVAFIFLLEPVNLRLGDSSLFCDRNSHSGQPLYSLLIAGACCGFLWELWNFWAGAKWMYTIPYLGRLKIFEMPLFGFFGFPPFAVECFVMINFFQAIRASLQKKAKPGQGGLGSAFLVIAFVLFCGAVFLGIDRLTVLSLRP